MRQCCSSASDVAGLALAALVAGAVAVAMLVTAPGVAHAQATGERRVDHAAAGRVAFESGRYRDALDHIQRAYEATGAPLLLYNIGQAADRMRLDATTLRAFQLYLQRYPDAPNHEEVEHRIRALRPLVDTQSEALAAETLHPVDARKVTVDVRETLMPSPYATPSARAASEPVPPTASATRSDEPRDKRSVLRHGWFWGIASAVVVACLVTVVVASHN
jgi:hypothetical protein